MPKLFKDGKYWYVDLRRLGGGKKSTGCTDKKAAEAIARRWERELADPVHAAAKAYKVSDAVVAMIDDRIKRGRAEGTISFYRDKCGHLVRIFGADTPLSEVDADAVDDYITQRREEKAGQHTLTKELTALRITLKLALRAGKFQRPLGAVMPVGWNSGYKPRDHRLTFDQADALIEACIDSRAQWVAFVLGTGARAHEAELALDGDIDLQEGTVRLRGTKTDRAKREVPVLPWTKKYLEIAKPPFAPFGDNLRHNYLDRACKRADVPYTTANDLRRTAASWLRERIGDSSLVGAYLGHMDGRMAERTYAQLAQAESLRKAIRIRTSTGQEDADD